MHLNLPSYNFKIKKLNGKVLIFDQQRKKYVSLTPEEWVRQNFIQFLITEKGYPAALIAVEKQLNVNGMKKRCDAILYSMNAEPLLIFEFKAPSVAITQDAFDQASIYNSKLNVTLLIISNGLNHFCCKVDKSSSSFIFAPEIPDYTSLLNAQNE